MGENCPEEGVIPLLDCSSPSKPATKSMGGVERARLYRGPEGERRLEFFQYIYDSNIDGSVHEMDGSFVDEENDFHSNEIGENVLDRSLSFGREYFKSERHGKTCVDVYDDEAKGGECRQKSENIICIRCIKRTHSFQLLVSIQKSSMIFKGRHRLGVMKIRQHPCMRKGQGIIG